MLKACFKILMIDRSNMHLKNKSNYFWTGVYILTEQRLFNITVTSQSARLRLKSPVSRLFTQPLVQAQIKENIKARSESLASVREIHRWPVNSQHKGPVTRKFFHLMTSSWRWSVWWSESLCINRILFFIKIFHQYFQTCKQTIFTFSPKEWHLKWNNYPHSIYPIFFIYTQWNSEVYIMCHNMYDIRNGNQQLQ